MHYVSVASLKAAEEVGQLHGLQALHPLACQACVRTDGRAHKHACARVAPPAVQLGLESITQFLELLSLLSSPPRSEKGGRKSYERLEMGQ